MKEKEKEAKERDTRITNGHHFNSITVSGNTLCHACNKSIITKEAFICPSEYNVPAGGEVGEGGGKKGKGSMGREGGAGHSRKGNRLGGGEILNPAR